MVDDPLVFALSITEADEGMAVRSVLNGGNFVEAELLRLKESGLRDLYIMISSPQPP